MGLIARHFSGSVMPREFTMAIGFVKFCLLLRHGGVEELGPVVHW